ncbi:aliphatic sulfonate ABC transporter substrate-binding protein [Ornithinimicrobium avium]|uniref:Putative aliphatic sulfonates-binding protein n=1 Tax=Ornithinimicrobium avium TaxID=2283195 RepID=A0A345NKD6_9MICO|nr:aliphatic sulfonate ABC transporter substrate-binding protein [Ornithinimicrobium avium]AXH95494.1 aliphatic sulfonate ABC transporter substrate-binding protein [Ornithinimicrobium avium]
MTTRRLVLALTAPVLAALLLTGCVAGEGSEQAAPAAGGSGWSDTELNIDFATYNPLSLIIKEKGWLEEELGDDVAVVWTQSAGSNKANEGLRAHAIDVGSTAGSAALLARANGSPIKTILLYSQPEWSALVAPAGSDIDEVEDLRGRSVAATKGTDPYFFLLQALAEHGLTLDDIEVQNLQHGDGKAALENGSVDAWSGLDPLMASSVQDAGSTLFYRNIDFNTYGFLNATEEFLQTSPDLAQAVVDAYERARAWAEENPEETVEILAEVAAIEPAIAEEVLVDRTVLDLDPVPGPVQTEVLGFVGTIFVESGDVPDQEVVDEALTSLYDTSFVNAALDETAGG